MTDRIFRQHALGSPGETTEITVRIDGETIYSGTVTPAAQPFPALPDYDYEINNIAYTWTGNIEVQGTSLYEVTVNSGEILLAETDCNNPLVDANVFGRTDIVEVVDPDGEEYYCYPYISNTRINAVPQPVNPYPWRQGQYWFRVGAGQVFSTDLHLIASIPPPPPIPPGPPPEDETPPG